MKIAFCTYADNNYKAKQATLHEAVSTMGFDHLFRFDRQWLTQTDFYYTNKFILDQSRGGGYWLWKPYIILQAFEKLAYNDALLYLDSGDTISPGILPFIKNAMAHRDILLTLGDRVNKHYTKRDCFVLMGCDTEDYWNCLQIEAGVILIKKTKQTIELLQEWLSYCSDFRISTDSKNEYELDNFDGFIDHRHDQSVLTNLAVKHALPASNAIRQFAKCNI